MQENKEIIKMNIYIKVICLFEKAIYLYFLKKLSYDTPNIN